MDTVQQELTPEKIAEMEKKMMEYYEQKLPLLRLQHEHDTLVAGIHMAEFTRIRAMSQIAEFKLSQKEQPVNTNGGDQDRENGSAE